MNCPLCQNELDYLTEDVFIGPDGWFYYCNSCLIDYCIVDGVIQKWAIGLYPDIELGGYSEPDCVIIRRGADVMYRAKFCLPNKDIIELYQKYLLLQ